MAFKAEDINLKDVNEFETKLQQFKVVEIGQGRGGGYDREILMKKLVYLQKKSTIDMNLFVKITKTFAIKFCLHGTRIKPDNRVVIDGKEYSGESVASIFEFKKSGKGTDQSQLTPTRLARMFATSAVEYCEEHHFTPPMYLQEDLKVEGLPASYHFLAAIYASGSEKYKEQLIALGKRFDTMMADVVEGYDKKNGFGPRFKFFFDHMNAQSNKQP
jgi:hypothetical protein